MSKFYDKSAASFRSTTIDSKVIDVQKILINTDPSQIDERKNLIDYVGNINNDITSVIKGGFKTAVYNTNVMNGTLDNATVTGIQYSNKHFVKGGSKIDSITFPYTPNSSVTSDGYLSAQVSVIEGVLENKIYYSTNKFNFGDTAKSEATFKFDDFILPENYLSVRFCLVSTRTTVPDNTQNTNCLSFRVKPIRYDNTFEFDVDGCYVYVNKDIKTWLIDSTINYGEPTKGIESIVLDNAEKVASLVEKTKLIREDDIFTINSQPTGYGECDAFSIHKDKIPSAPIKSIEIPVVNTISTPTYIVVYDVDSATSTKKLLGNSRESITWTSGGVAKWTFENALNIPDGHNIEIYLAKASSVIGESNVAPVGYNISIYSNGTGNDRIRYGNSWNYTREIYLIFHTEEERNLGEAIENTESNINVMSQLMSDHILTSEEKFDEIEGSLNGLENKNYAFTDTSNTFLSPTTFDASVTLNDGFTTSPGSSIAIKDNLNVLPLGVKTAAGADAYGLHVSSTGGVQIWGTHFLQGDEWSDTALKIQHRNLALFGDHNAPTSLTFDNANTIEFKVMPNDGSSANDGQGAIFDFSAWQWDNDSHTTKNSNCPVQILKNNAGELVDRSVLNKAELDANYIIANDDNKHIVEVLNETIDTQSNYATGWVQLRSNSEIWVFRIDNYPDITLSGVAVPYGRHWAEAINNANIPFTAHEDENNDTIFHIKAKNAGVSYCVPFGFVDSITGGRFESLVDYSSETLEIGEATIKKIDFLSDVDTRFAQRNTDNTFSGLNTFEQDILAKENIVVRNGVLTFEDLIDGTVIENSGASGYRYVEGMPSSFNNGVCYDIGEISNTTDLSNITFSAEGRLVQTCELWFKTPTTVPTTHKWPTNIYWIDSATGAAPTLIASKNYRLVFRQEPNKIIASIAYLY